MRTVCSGDSTLCNICNREEIDCDAFLMIHRCGRCENRVAGLQREPVAAESIQSRNILGSLQYLKGNKLC